MSVEERAADIKTRLRNDMAKTLSEYGLLTQSGQPVQGMGGLTDALMEDALHQIEPLLLEIEEKRSTPVIAPAPHRVESESFSSRMGHPGGHYG